MGIAVAIILLPMPGTGFLVAFGGPNISVQGFRSC